MHLHHVQVRSRARGNWEIGFSEYILVPYDSETIPIFVGKRLSTSLLQKEIGVFFWVKTFYEYDHRPFHHKYASILPTIVYETKKRQGDR